MCAGVLAHTRHTGREGKEKVVGPIIPSSPAGSCAGRLRSWLRPREGAGSVYPPSSVGDREEPLTRTHREARCPPSSPREKNERDLISRRRRHHTHATPTERNDQPKTKKNPKPTRNQEEPSQPGEETQGHNRVPTHPPEPNHERHSSRSGGGTEPPASPRPRKGGGRGWQNIYYPTRRRRRPVGGGARVPPPTESSSSPSHSDLNVNPSARTAPASRNDARRTDARRSHTRWRSRRGRPGGAPRSRRTLLPAPALPGGSVGGRLDNTAGASPPALSPLALGHAMRPTANRHKTPPNRAPRRVAAPRGLTQKHPLKRGAPGSATHHSGSTTAAKPT